MITKKKDCDHSCFMCRYVISDWKELIKLKRKVIKVKKGEQFLWEGSTADGVYFVQQGLVKVHKQWADKENIIRFAKKGDIVGHRGLSHEVLTYPISATALESSELCFLPIDFFKTVLKTNPKLTYQLLMFCADELRVSEQKITNQVQLTVKGRLAWNFLELQKHMGCDAQGHIAIALSKTDLAAYLGTTYESVYRVLLEMIEEGAVEVNAKRIKLLDMEKLRIYSKI